ncbi:MAG: hypothetical protein WCG35_09250 [Betaproteobacteria bacterium]
MTAGSLNYLEFLMFEKKADVDRRAFATAVRGRELKEDVMITFGIAQSTFYQWNARLRKYGDQWIDGKPITRAKRIGRSTLEVTHEKIVELSLLHPTFGPKQLVDILNSTKDYPVMSSSTVHNILSAKKLSTRSLRALELHRRFTNDKNLKLTFQQERLIETIDPLAFCRSWAGRRSGEKLTQDVISLLPRSLFGKGMLSIVVDTFDGVAFAAFYSNCARGDVSIFGVNDAIEELLDRVGKIDYMYTDKGYEFGEKYKAHPYNESLRAWGINHRLISQAGTKRNPYIEKVWVELQEFLINGGVTDLQSYRGRLHVLNPIIKKYLNERYVELGSSGVNPTEVHGISKNVSRNQTPF